MSRASTIPAMCLCAGLYLAPVAARAMDFQRLWLNDDQRGARQMEKHDYASAARTFDDQRWQATAWYRAGDYKRAAEAWSKMDDIDAHYNRGNALARSGDLKGAAAEYETVLKRDPDNADARHNLEVIRKLMKSSKKSSSEKQTDASKRNNDQSGNDGNGAGKKQSKQNEGSGGAGSERNQAGSGNRRQQSRGQDHNRSDQSTASKNEERQDRKQRSRQARSSSSDEGGGKVQGQRSREREDAKITPEQQAAMEQWLRRIPDDPGGLLRRKFRYQYSQRRRGDEQADQPW